VLRNPWRFGFLYEEEGEVGHIFEAMLDGISNLQIAKD